MSRTRTRVVRRLVAVVAPAVAAVGLASCVPQPTAGISCAWAIKADKASFNVAYPDATATYFGTKYNLVAGQRLILSGAYPYARYISLHTYTLAGNDHDHIADTAIVPDAGSDNPFTNLVASADPAHRRWTVTVNPDIAPTDGQHGDNVISTPTNGSVFLRVYVPDDPADQAGGVPLPSLSVQNVDGTITPVPTCSASAPDNAAVDLINLFGPATDVPPSDPPVFRRPVTVAGIYPNRDNAYLASIAAYQPGKVIVVRGKAPTTPDTQAGQSPATPSQLRYWSFCTNEYRKPYPVSSCIVDHEAPVDASGYYTIVVSTPAERPANATTTDGVAWVDWGSTSTNLLMAVRHMLPAPDFAETVRNVALGQLASEVMGAYTPVAVSCPVSTFESGGAAACGL
ncbi:MAG: hypothetical protein U0Q22_08235 [Acidimicrobiales bacterium]